MKKKNVYKIFMILFWSLTFITWILPDRILFVEYVLPIPATIFTILYIIKRQQLKKKQVEELSRTATSIDDINML